MAGDIPGGGIHTQPGANIFALESPRQVRTVIDHLREQRTKYVVALGEGYAKSFEDYRYRVGQIEGMNAAIRMCEQIMKEES